MGCFFNDLEINTIDEVQAIINKNNNYYEVMHELINKGYELRVSNKNGYLSKTESNLYLKGQYTCVDLHKKRNNKVEISYIWLS